LWLGQWEARVIDVLGFEDFHRLFENCMDMLERAPPEQRDTLIEIAETFLMLANDCIWDDAEPHQTAPTILMT
jgi:hypothetical protein